MRSPTFAVFLVLISMPAQAQDDWKKAAGDLQGCYIKSLSFGESFPYTMLTCLDQMSSYCDAQKVSDERCRGESYALYKQTIPIYQAEHDNYTRARSFGGEYEPIFFDIRSISP